jgi:hypothetical protein
MYCYGVGRQLRPQQVMKCIPYKHNVSLADVLLGVGGEEQVAAPALLHYLKQPRLVDCRGLNRIQHAWSR